jgi:hypothetical protein
LPVYFVCSFDLLRQKNKREICEDKLFPHDFTLKKPALFFDFAIIIMKKNEKSKHILILRWPSHLQKSGGKAKKLFAIIGQ